MRVITFGTFDLFHIGHLNILKRAKELGTYLIVGVSSDELNRIKGKTSAISLNSRLEIIKSIKYVDEVFIEESLELKEEYIKKYQADILVMGDDWKNKFDDMPCKVIYLNRTPNISTSDIKYIIIEKEKEKEN
jgi:glycerol-3-phosphate cytidylyltransferase